MGRAAALAPPSDTGTNKAGAVKISSNWSEDGDFIQVRTILRVIQLRLKTFLAAVIFVGALNPKVTNVTWTWLL
jgi:hypothetical protein